MFPPFFGPVSHRLKAGDRAPDFTSGKLLHSPVGTAWTSSNFDGHFTILNFCPNTTANPGPVAKWNAMVRQFVAEPVHFLWITAEDESALLPWLAQSPVDGWVLHDSSGQAARSFGLETPQSVIVGPDRRILGYDHLQSSEHTVRAALEGRTTTTPPKSGMAAILEFAEAGRVLLRAEPITMPRPGDHRPKFPPSHTLHVSPSEPESAGGNYSAPDYRNWLGLSVTTFIAEMYETSPARIDLPAGLDDDRRYDFAMVLPEPVRPEEMSRLMQQGIQDHYHLTVTREIRLLDVYVMTVPTGTTPVIKAGPDDGDLGYSCSFSSSVYIVGRRGDPEPESTLDRPMPLSTVGSVSMSNATMDDFCRFLERHLDRPLVNETNLTGNFDLQVTGSRAMSGDFIQRLRDQLGLVVTVAPRPVEMLIFRR